MASDDRAIWSLIRETRSARPGAAAKHEKRAQVYGAALQQFEELMRAAQSVGYASRSLPLFYAVSQAGRAIAAAWADQPWELHGHGLKFEAGKTLLRSTNKPEPKATGSFQRVTEVTQDGGGLKTPVELGALWASLPDLNGHDLRDERWRRPVVVRREPEDPATSPLLGAYVVAQAGFAVDRWPHLRMFSKDQPSGQELDAEFEDLMRHFPTAEGWQPYRPQGLRLVQHDYFGNWFTICWPAQSPTPGAREWAFREHVFEHRISGTWWLRPDLNDAGDFLWPLTTWWALLFGLSMLARYHPAEWTRALRVDESAETVPLEAALDSALEVVPHFVLEALRREQVMVRG